VEPNEEVAEVVERKHRNPDVALDDGELREAIRNAAVLIRFDPEDAVAQRLFGRREIGIGVELVDGVRVVHAYAGRQRKGAVADSEVEEEVARPQLLRA
jgi:hypothetical protein